MWAEGFAFSSYGVKIGVRVTDPSILGELRSRLPHGVRMLRSPIVEHLCSVVVGGAPRKGVRRYHILYDGGGRIVRTFELQTLLDRFESVVRIHAAAGARDRVFIHAGVVGWQGRGVLVVGPSNSGKTELIAALVERGATYYSDEYAVVDAGGRVHPFPKPLSFRRNGRRVRVAVQTEEGQAPPRPLPVGIVLSTAYDVNARWRPRRLSPGQGVLAMLENTVSARVAPDRAFATLRRVAGAAPVLRGARGEASEAARQLLAHLARQPAS